ncbi:hypothetical protein [Agrobacterium tumefaciens]|uniref:hypothetical protein n=1 Tax=Agrobacterium tumefaciens TaxID=358 RepID=UPI001573BD6F|nr:hypothetical protein [Agrobacterium tumefaciens]NTD85443.1 hypothetical protein [Agrobacterium tumefaciens]NTD90792.1 hypothetical protein [Agrobacterium tumefaciens]NTD96411.1 hypothetical protein [Agrobacterium tumefaciens]NTE15866.1 hypothetical protein [Agrobacterium tumefaciens]NTE23145.1 hypothetical protein [Agrobacterium tumefaciens]
MSFREYTPTTPATPAFGKTWIVNARWAHPIWHSYAVLLYDLTTNIPGAPTPAIYKDGVTHELMIYALDPDFPDDPPTHMLSPANYGYQFYAETDQAAEARIVSILRLIEAMQLSPDTDFRSAWDSLFLDGVTLHMKGGAA